MRAPLLAALLASLLLAGCAAQDGPGGGDGGGVGNVANTPLTTADARTLLSGLDANMPDRYGMDVAFTKDAKEVMRMTGAFDNASGESYMEIRMDPSAFPEGSGGMEGSEALFANGFAVYVTSDGNAYIINDTVFTFPPDDEGSSFVPSPEESPFGEFMDPESAFGDLDENVTIHSVRPITHNGKAAAEIVASIKDEEGASTNATIIVYRDPARLARISGDIPADPEDTSGLSGGVATVDLMYDDEVSLQIPQKAKRAIGLRYTNSAGYGGFGGFGGGSEGPTTWTFESSAGIALTEIEAQVKDASATMEEGNEDAGPDAIALAPTLWSMKLSEGTKTQDGATLTFDDADGDGKVSAGDTLTIEAGEEGEAPTVILYDTVTGAYVMPGPGVLLVALALAGAAALTLRRK